MRHVTWSAAHRGWSLRYLLGRAAVLALLPLGLAGCVATLTPAVVVNPLDAGVDYTQLATMKQGKSCATTYLYLFGPSGSASVAAAAVAGELHTVRYVDNRYENNILRQRYCIIAYGQ